MKQLKFDHKFVENIVLNKTKTTLRLDNKGVKVGDRLQLVDKTTNNHPQEWKIPGELIIESIQEFMLEKLPSELVASSEVGSMSEEKLYQFLRRFYGDDVNNNSSVSLLSFKFAPYDKPLPYLLQKSPDKDVIFDRVKLYADGGSRGNPGPSAAGFVILDQKETVIESWNKYIGITTNNQAEYHAFIAGLEWCKRQNVQEVSVFLDSLLVVNQMRGVFKVKNRDLWALYEAAKKLQSKFKKITFTHVPRELNKLADAEVNKALDAVKDDEVLQ